MSEGNKQIYNWIKLPSIRFKHRLKVLQMDSRRCLFTQPPIQTIHIYDIRSDTFEDILPCKHPTEEYFRDEILLPCMTQNKIYLFSAERPSNELYELNMENKALELSSTDIQIGDFPRIVQTGDDIHFIGGDGYHYIYNIKDQTAEEIREYESLDIQYVEKAIYLKTKGCILILDQSHFASFSLHDKKWIKLKACQFNYDHYTKVVMTCDDKYVFFMAVQSENGSYGSLEILGEIYAFNATDYTFKKCSMRWPEDGPMEAIMVRDAERDKLLAFGYVNMCFKLKEMTNVQVLPHYLIALIGKWFMMEYIHLFTHLGEGYDSEIDLKHYHWKINVDHLIASIGDEIEIDGNSDIDS